MWNLAANKIMKRKLFTLLLAFSLALSFTACGSSDPSNEGPYAISVKKGLFNTKVSIPSAFTTSANVEEAGQSTFDLVAIANAQGIDNITTHEDGSISMKMTNNAYKTFLTKIKIEIDNYNNEFLENNADTCSFLEIVHDINISEFNITADTQEYTSSDILSTKSLYFFGTLYQSLSSTARADVKTVVNILDSETNDIIHTDSLTFDQYIEILEGTNELSTEELDSISTTAASTAIATTAATGTTSTALTTTTASTATTTATTAATTATTQATTATTAVQTPTFNTADQANTTTTATTQPTNPTFNTADQNKNKTTTAKNSSTTTATNNTSSPTWNTSDQSKHNGNDDETENNDDENSNDETQEN